MSLTIELLESAEPNLNPHTLKNCRLLMSADFSLCKVLTIADSGEFAEAHWAITDLIFFKLLVSPIWTWASIFALHPRASSLV